MVLEQIFLDILSRSAFPQFTRFYTVTVVGGGVGDCGPSAITPNGSVRFDAGG